MDYEQVCDDYICTATGIQEAPNDQTQYRRLRLANGLEVIVGSNPRVHCASASIAILLGSLHEPVCRFLCTLTTQLIFFERKRCLV